MNTMVVYDSQYGNTECIAQTIADALYAFGHAQAVRVDPARPVSLQGVDLLILGSPTQGLKPTLAMQSFLETASIQQIRGRALLPPQPSRLRWVVLARNQGSPAGTSPIGTISV